MAESVTRVYCGFSCGNCAEIECEDMILLHKLLWNIGWRPFNYQAWLCQDCVYMRQQNGLQAPYPEEPLEDPLFVGWVCRAHLVGAHSHAGVH